MEYIVCNCPLADKDRIEKILQYVENIINKEEKDKLSQQILGQALADAYASNYKHYLEQLAIWEKLPFIERKFIKKPKYH